MTTASNTTTNSNAYRGIYEQYVDDASFLWLMRSIAVDQPHYDINDLKELEQRIDAQLDGLMTSIDLSWELCEQALEMEAGGEVFTAAMVAFRSHDQDKIQKVVDAGFATDDCIKGLASALAWLPGYLVHPWIKRFFTSKDFNHKYLAIKACGLRRENPEDYLNTLFQRDDCLQHEKLYASLLRISGELKRHDLIEHVTKALEHDNETIKFWAIWSSIILGNRDVINKLEPYIFKAGPYQDKAIKLAFSVMPVEQSRQWVSQLVADKAQTRNVIIATGVIGDPHAVDWLILKMREINFARVAAEAFSMITGADLEKMLLTQEVPEHLDEGPNDDPEDDNVKMHDDENLPWPNVELVAVYWNGIKAKFVVGQRYLLGVLIKPENLTNKLDAAYQRQRHAVALELSLANPSQILQNTSAKVPQG